MPRRRLRVIIVLAVICVIGLGVFHILRPGRVNPWAVRMVVYQRSRAFAPSKPASRPPRFLPKDTPLWWIGSGETPPQSPAVITDRADIRRIAYALNHQDDDSDLPIPPTDVLALVQNNGKVMGFQISDARRPEIWIDWTWKSSILSSALSKAILRSRPAGLVLRAPIDTVSLVGAHGVGKISMHATPEIDRMIRELLTCWCPYELRWKYTFNQCELARVARYLSPRMTITLSRSTAMEAVLPYGWHPEKNAEVKEIRYDTIHVIREGKGGMVLGFVDTRSGTCLVTDRVCSLKILRNDPAKLYPDYGPDLFDALVSAVRASRNKQ